MTRQESAAPSLVLVRGGVLVAGALLVCGWVTGFFVAWVVADLRSPSPRPLAEHFDAQTLVSAALFGVLFFLCLRAYARQRRGAAEGSVLPRVVRLVPLLLVAGLVAGGVTGARSARESGARRDFSAASACDDLFAEAPGAAPREACLDAARACDRERLSPIAPPGMTPQTLCLRRALGLAVD